MANSHENRIKGLFALLNRSRMVKVLFIVGFVLLGLVLIRFVASGSRQSVTPTHRIAAASVEPTHQNTAVKRAINSKFQTKLVQTLKQDNYSGSAIIYDNGQQVASYNAGYANYLSRIKNQANTMYEINSIQKSITGVLVMQQVAKRQLALSDRLNKFYPNVPGSQNITIRQMLNMTSGLIMTGPVGPMVAKTDTQIIQSDISRVHYLRVMHGRWNYQAINFNLLCGILEKITHQSYQQLFYEQIIERLHLQRTAFAYKLPNSTIAATGYDGLIGKNQKLIYTKPSVRNQALEQDELGTGQVYMSVGDLYRVESAIVSGKIVPLQLLQQLYQGGSYSKYEAGFYTHKQVKSVNGAGYGFESSIHISPNGKNAVILLSNYQEPLFRVRSLAQKFDYLLFN